MGPVNKIANYGTFLVPSGCDEVEVWREGTDTYPQQGETCPNPPFKRALTNETFDYYLRRALHGNFGFHLHSDGTSIFISDVDHQVTQVCQLHEGDEVTHVDGQPVSNSLEETIRCLERAGDGVQLRVRKAAKSYQELAGSGNDGWSFVQHRVRQGDSVETIAERYSTTPEQIRSDNRRNFPIGEPGFICPGQTLTISCGIGTGRKSKGRRGDTGARRRQQVLYNVQEGDSLESICMKFGAKSAEIRRCNRSIFPVGESGNLGPGQTLTIFV